MDATLQPLDLLAINLTRRCNLACAHCYLDASARRSALGELETEEVQRILDEVAGRGDGTMVVLTGGEPLVRRDMEAIVAHGARQGLAMVVGTNGTLLTDRRVESLKEAGTLGVGVSLDSLDPLFHDRFRGRPGSWEKALAGVEACRRHELSFQIHFSVMEGNAHELADMAAFARASGARVLNVFFLVCTGRAESVTDISPLRYEKALRQVIDLQESMPDLIVRARCAPHYKRLAYERNPDSPLNRIPGAEGDGCIAGTRYCRVTPEGGVTACPYIEDAVGNVRDAGLMSLWDTAGEFARLRAPALGGKCGACEYRRLCGGCRARPVARGGGLMDADPMCAYVPRGGAVVEPLPGGRDGGVQWTPEAEARLSRVPGFLQRLVRRRAEAYVAELGEQVVTPDHLSTLVARRFGGGGPRRPGSAP